MKDAKETTSVRTAEPKIANTAEQIGEAYTNLARALHGGSLATKKKQDEACLAFAKTKHQIEVDAAQRAVEAYDEYTKSAQNAAQEENAQHLPEEAYQNYAATLQGLQEDSSRRLQEAYRDLATQSSQAASDGQQQVRQHYVDYLKSIQSVWASIDVESLVA